VGESLAKHLATAFVGGAALACALGCAGAAVRGAPAPAPPAITLTAPPPILPPLPTGTAIRIAFAPPLERPIRFIRDEEKSIGPATQRTSMLLVVRFSKAGDGYLMEGRTEIPALPPELAGSPEIQLALRPITFRLDRTGSFVGIEKEDDYWRGIYALADRLGRGAQAKRGDAALYRSIFRAMRALPTADRVALIGRNFLPITAFATIDMAVGETGLTQQQQSRLPVPGIRASLKRYDEARLTRATTEWAIIDLVPHLDEAAMASAFAALQKLGRKKPRAEPAPRLMGTATALVSRRTGLALSYEETLDALPPGGVLSVRAIRLTVMPR
jgi:hypothetical protein